MTTIPPMTPRGNGDGNGTPERTSEFNVIAGKYYIFEYMEDSQGRAVILVAGDPKSNKFFTPGVVDPSLINAEEVVDDEKETTTQMDVPFEDVDNMTMIEKSFASPEEARGYYLERQTLTRGGNNKNKNKNKNRSKMTKKSKKGKKSMKNRTRKNKSRKNKSRKGK